MTAAAHTEGPWHVEPVCNEDEKQFWSDDWNGKVFCVCHPRTVCDATTVVGWINEGDARLIAAAPELLEALENARRQLEAYELERTGEAYNDLRINAAIAKAKGNQHG